MKGTKTTNKITAQNHTGPPPVVTRSKGKARTDTALITTNVKRLKLKPSDLVDPDVQAWDHQLHNMFERDADPVGMPLFEDNYPCPTTIAANYGSASVAATTGNTIQIWCTPNGSYAPNGDYIYNDALVAVAGATNCRPGSVLTDYAGSRAGAAFYRSSAAVMTSTATYLNVAPVFFDDLNVPFSCGGTTTGMQYRDRKSVV